MAGNDDIETTPVSRRVEQLGDGGIRFEHNKAEFLCYVDGIPDSREKAIIEQQFPALLHEREWVVEPNFEWDDDSDDVTLGVSLTLPAATTGLSRERQLLEDVIAVIEWAIALSADYDIDFAFEYNGDSAGWVEGGQPDTLLTEGLIEPWRSRLDG